MNPETPKKIDEYLLLYALLDHQQKESAMEWFEWKLRLEEASSDDVYTISGLSAPIDVPAPKGARRPRKKYTFTPPESQKDIGSQVGFLGLDGKVKKASVDSLDLSKGEITIAWSANNEKEAKESDWVLNEETGEEEWVEKKVTAGINAFTNVKSFPKVDHQGALIEIIMNYLDEDSPDTVAAALIRRELPNTTVKDFEGDKESIQAAVSGLRKSYFPVQGPPGTGKTYVGAHLIHHLITTQNARVGIVSQSGSAIDNLLHKTLEVFKKEDDLGRYKNKFVRNPSEGGVHSDIQSWVDAGDLDLKKYEAPKEGEPLDPAVHMYSSYCLAASTSWFWVHKDMSEEVKFDYLVIDEAGQFSLAEALAVTKGAHNLVLLGDPQQLPQVTKGAHDFGADTSVLEHVVGENENRLLAPGQGSFLDKSYRMRPEVCKFISEEFYESSLTVSDDGRCSLRSIENQKDGLREIQIIIQEIDGGGLPDYVIESEVEAKKVREVIKSLKNTTWVDVEETDGDVRGKEKKLLMENFMVVAPYNAQVSKIRSLLKPNDFYFEETWTSETWSTFQEFENDYYSKDANKHEDAVDWWREQTMKVVGTVDKFQGREAPVVIYSLTTSREDLIPAGRGDFIFLPNRLNVAISRAQCLAVLVGTEELINSQAKSIEQMKALNHLCRFFEDRETKVDGRMMIGEAL